MIRFNLKCAQSHDFESWFASGEAFDALRSNGQVECPICGSHDVEKAIMAPRVRPARSSAVAPAESKGALSKPGTEVEAELANLRDHVEKNSDYVGMSFASEARKMHDGDIPHRAIYGEAKSDEAKKLIEDGVPVAPLPFIPQRKTN